MSAGPHVSGGDFISAIICAFENPKAFNLRFASTQTGPAYFPRMRSTTCDSMTFTGPCASAREYAFAASSMYTARV